MFEEYWGQALHVARVGSRLSQDDVCQKLGISQPILDGMEKEVEPISPKLFKAWAELLGGEIRILKMAQRLQDNSQFSDQEILERTIKELDYLTWKKENPS